MLPSSAPNLAAPTGDVVTVSTGAQLLSAVQNIVSGRTIVINPGTYSLSSIGPLFFNAALSSIAIRGSTNSYDDVILQGAGMSTKGPSDYGIWMGGGVNGMQIANLTIRDIYFSPIQMNPGSTAIRLYHCRLLDAGQQFVKSAQGAGTDDCRVEYCQIEYTTFSRSPTVDDPYNGYTNGVDCKGANWVIADNFFKNIKSNGALAGPAVICWQGSADAIVERNTFLSCAREIAMGLTLQSGFNDNLRGIVRNNMLYRPSGQANSDVGIGVADSPNTALYNNTVMIHGTYGNAIEYRFATTSGTIIRNNIIDAGLTARDGAPSATQSHLLTGATDALYVSPTTGDLHLLVTANVAIDQGFNVGADCNNDWDGQDRPVGVAYDLGADEYSVAVSSGRPLTFWARK